MARKIGMDMMEENEDLLKPFRPLKKEEQGAMEDQPKAQRTTDSSNTEDLPKPCRGNRKGNHESESRSTPQSATSEITPSQSAISGKVNEKSDGGSQMQERRIDYGEIDVSLRVQSVKDNQNHTSAEPPVPDDTQSAVRSVSAVSVFDDLSQSSLRRLRNMSERAVRKVKTFVSRPIKEATMRRFVHKVEARKQAEMTGQIMSCGRGPDMSIKSVINAAPSSRYGDLPSGNWLVYGNKNNNGKLMINDEPFWTLQKKPTEADLEESGTEDDMQLNADTALEVYEGKTKLENMPAIPIILDPFNELSELKRRDDLFYTKAVLFGNSIRSMINLCDNSTKVTPAVRRRGQAQVTFREPEAMYSYSRERFAVTRKVPFKPGLASSRRISRRQRKKRTPAKAGMSGVGGSTPSDNKNGKPAKKSKRLGERLVQAVLDNRDGGEVKENEENQDNKSPQQLEVDAPVQIG
ncbi:hypothetical protein ANCCAN_03277 [Ancylostoma caninum]|uniref:Uncharacterized protein n=1 Tax=Ancylostoma caninum TaxID=29170 RepID=A0A368H239_ANCCA|nr:hypothetical protein ANCCAN_03277 [Ancylostoma caninum]